MSSRMLSHTLGVKMPPTTVYFYSAFPYLKKLESEMLLLLFPIDEPHTESLALLALLVKLR